MTWKPLPSPGGRDDPPPRPIRHSLDRLTRALGAPSVGALATLFSRWDEIVGPAVAAHTKPLTLRDQELVVAVDDGAWATQISYLEADLCRRANDVLGPAAVARIRIRVRPA